MCIYLDICTYLYRCASIHIHMQIYIYIYYLPICIYLYHVYRASFGAVTACGSVLGRRVADCLVAIAEHWLAHTLGFVLEHWAAKCKCRRAHLQHRPAARFPSRKCGCSEYASLWKCLLCDCNQPAATECCLCFVLLHATLAARCSGTGT